MIKKWDFSTEEWVRVLTGHGFESAAAEIVDPPKVGQLGTLLVRATSLSVSTGG